MHTDDILFNSGSLWFTEDGDLDWSLILSGDTNEKEDI